MVRSQGPGRKPAKIKRRPDWAHTELNIQVGKALLKARTLAGGRKRLSQPEFAKRLASELGGQFGSQSAVSEWENGDSAAPAVVLIAAARIASRATPQPVTVDALLMSETAYAQQLAEIFRPEIHAEVDRYLRQRPGKGGGGRA